MRVDVKPAARWATLLLAVAARAGEADTQTSDVGCLADVAAFLSVGPPLEHHHAYGPQERGPMAPPAHGPLFHLHVPRTGGRTFHGCLLTPAYPVARRCRRCYEVGAAATRLARRGGDCGLLASHDDASLLDVLPAHTHLAVQLRRARRGAGRRVGLDCLAASHAFLPPSSLVPTPRRDPVDRVLSVYEYAVEAAALALARDRGEQARLGGQVATAARRRPAQRRTPVDAVWPWSQLVPWVKADMQRQAGSNGSVVMSLPDFVSSFAAAEHVHDGATLQLLGATNVSSRPGAAARVRACLAASPRARALALDTALARLRAAGHVGTLERLDESVAAAAAAFGWDLAGPARGPAGGRVGGTHAVGAADPAPGGVSRPSHLPSLVTEFRECEDRTRQAAARRRAAAARLLPGCQAPLGGGRRSVDPAVLDSIRRLNTLDAAVYAEADALLTARLQEGRAARLPPPTSRGGQRAPLVAAVLSPPFSDEL